MAENWTEEADALPEPAALAAAMEAARASGRRLSSARPWSVGAPTSIRAAFGHDDGALLNRSYVELARHYGFRIDPTPPRSPEKKGKVERAGAYVKRNFLATHTSVDIETDRAALRVCLEQAAARRRHGVTGRRPIEMFEAEEKEALLTLAERPFEVVLWKEVKVHRDAHVQIDGALYSVPWEHMGERVEIKIQGQHLSIYRQGAYLWTHVRVGRRRRQTVPAHVPEHRGDLGRRSRLFWLERASVLGPFSRRLCEAILTPRMCSTSCARSRRW